MAYSVPPPSYDETMSSGPRKKHNLPQCLQPGYTIEAAGVYHSESSKFSLNIGNMNSDTLLFHLDFRPTESCIVMNSTRYGTWDEELRTELPSLAAEFSVSVRMLNKCFVVFVNDILLLETFPYRAPLDTADFVELTDGSNGMMWTSMTLPGSDVIRLSGDSQSSLSVRNPEVVIFVNDTLLLESPKVINNIEIGKKYPISKPLKFGDKFICQAEVKATTKFSFNIRQKEDFLLHVDFRYAERVIVLNNRTASGWQKEVRPQWFALGEVVVLEVEIGLKSYIVSVNGRKLSREFPQRVSIDKAEYIQFILEHGGSVKWSDLQMP